MAGWTTADMPSLEGRLAVVTGGSGGLGYETSLALAMTGAEVVIAARNPEKGKDALDRIRAVRPSARVRYEKLDLASLASIAAFGLRLSETVRAVDVLVNNGGVMAPPRRQATVDGFELQFGTNYLGHFALTAHLLPLLRSAERSRIVGVSSVAHRQGRIGFDDLQSERSYSAWKAYAQSKLAMLMFSLELDRRNRKQNWGILSLASHPGWARTDLIANGPRRSGLWRVAGLAAPLFSQPAPEGALPILYAATSPNARGGGYYGPDGAFELTGSPAPARIAPQALDRAAGARLWTVSERLTRTDFDPPGLKAG